jgi:hypothetical protein
MRDKQGVGEIETIEVSGKGLEVEVKPQVATNAIECGGVWREEGELVQSGSVEMRRKVVAVSGRLLW